LKSAFYGDAASSRCGNIDNGRGKSNVTDIDVNFNAFFISRRHMLMLPENPTPDIEWNSIVPPRDDNPACDPRPPDAMV
jgi:hypothetical protein